MNLRNLFPRIKWWLLGTGAFLLLALGYLLLIPMTRMFILSYLRGEPFHEGKPLSFWMDQLSAGDRREKLKATAALGEMRPRASTAVPVLIGGLSDEDLEVRRSCANVLGQMGPAAANAAPALVAAIPTIRMGGNWSSCTMSELGVYAEFLADFGPKTVPALIEGLRHEKPEVRYCAAWALARLAPDPQVAVPALIEALRDPSHRRQLRDLYQDSAQRNELFEMSFRRIAVTLGEMGPEAKEAAEVILGVIKDGTGPIKARQLPNDNLLFAQEGEPLPALAKIDSDLGEAAQAYAVISQNPPDQTSFRKLLGALQSPQKRVRELAAFALSQSNSFPQDETFIESAIKALTRTLEDEAVEVRWSGAAALVFIAAGRLEEEILYRRVLPALIEALIGDREHLLVRLSAAKALNQIVLMGKVRAELKKSAPAFLEALKDPVREVRWETFKALKELNSLPPGNLQARQSRTDPPLEELVHWAATILLPERQFRPKSLSPIFLQPREVRTLEAAQGGVCWLGQIDFPEQARPQLSLRQTLPVDLAFCERWIIPFNQKSYDYWDSTRQKGRPAGWVVPQGTKGLWTLIPPQDLLNDLEKRFTEPGEHRFTLRIILEPSPDAAFYNDLKAFWPGRIELPITAIWVTAKKPVAAPKFRN